MKLRILFLFKYFLFWVIWFVLSKIIFISYHFNAFSKINPLKTIPEIILSGLRLDFSMCAYILVLPFFLIALSSFFNPKIFLKIISFYTILLLFISSCLLIVDIELFTYWGFRLDSTVIKYINTPAEAMASSLSSPLLLLSCMLIAFIIAGIYFSRSWLFLNTDFPKGNFISFIVIFLLMPFLVIPLRGGLQQIPINQSSVYFSNNFLANQAAINLPWNFIHSILEKSYDKKNPYLFFPEKIAKKEVETLYIHKDENENILKISRPNILLIIWESFTAKALLNYEGKEITPNFNALSKEGIYFNNIYASGDRSDKGIIAILSGYPAQPVNSIITNPSKSIKLPTLAKSLKQNGYTTSFLYGGELEFANIKSYLLNGGFDKILGKNSFPKDQWNSKWGAHDEYVFNKQYELLNKSSQPFFATTFTLSSHEPFEIPMQPLLKAKSIENKFLNSLHYTDGCLGDFIKKSKTSAWWKNTLVIIIADHGHPLPGTGIAEHVPADFKIPLLLLGGALNQSRTISKVGSQTDLASTLLNQLDISDSSFTFSKNLFNPSSQPFSYYAFNNGFGYINEKGKFVYDNVSNNFIHKEGEITDKDLKTGKAFLQFSYQDYLNK